MVLWGNLGVLRCSVPRKIDDVLRHKSNTHSSSRKILLLFGGGVEQEIEHPNTQASVSKASRLRLKTSGVKGVEV